MNFLGICFYLYFQISSKNFKTKGVNTYILNNHDISKSVEILQEILTWQEFFLTMRFFPHNLTLINLDMDVI